MNLTKKKIEDLEQLGRGHFGTVYKYGDYAIKIYHPELKQGFKMIKNPCLKRRRYFFVMNRLKNMTLKETVLTTTPVYISGVFSGIAYPYFSGTVLNKMFGADFDYKQMAALRFIEKIRDLTDNMVYPTDIKLNNVLAGDDVSIIDLDDILTKNVLFPNPFYLDQCLRRLKWTLMIFFHPEYLWLPNVTITSLNNEASRVFECQHIGYDMLTDYVNGEGKKITPLFLSSEGFSSNDFEYLRNFINFKEGFAVLTIPKDKTHAYRYITDTINFLNENGIVINDVMFESRLERDIDTYIKSHNSTESYRFCSKRFIKIK